MENKAILFDASTLITFAMNGLLPEFRRLKEVFGGRFIITDEVKYEVIDRPLNVKRFELEAMKVNQLLTDGVLEGYEVFGVNKSEITKGTEKMMNIANSMFVGDRGDIDLIHKGESSCLALSRILDKKKIPHLIAVDERTTRMLSEKPDNLRKLLERKLHTKITLKKKEFKYFQGFRIIRSAELVYIVYKKKLIGLRDKKLLDALLYAVKFKGCSISDQEIAEIKKIG